MVQYIEFLFLCEGSPGNCRELLWQFPGAEEAMKKTNIYTYSFYPIDARMYVVLENSKALVVDPCESEEALQMLVENSVTDILVLLTHEHFDHISGVNWLRGHFASVCVTCSGKCARALPEPSGNLSRFWEVLFIGKDEETQEYVRNMDVQPYSCEADQSFEGECVLEWEGHSIYMKETPGHSQGSVCILLDGEILFSGDSLVTGCPAITRLPGGSRKEYAAVALPYLRSLAPELMVYPGHGERKRLDEYADLKKNAD